MMSISSIIRKVVFLLIIFTFIPSMAANYISSLGELKADKIGYDSITQIVSAEGDIIFSDDKGNEFQAEEAKLTNGLSKGYLKGLNGRLSNSANISADKIDIIDKNRYNIENATYSPCSIICLFGDKNKKTRLWQIKARDIKVNQDENLATYKNASMEVFGLPILYTPVFSHILDTRKSKSGFLIPEYRDSSLLGSEVKIPLFLSLRSNFDVELASRITSKEGVIFEGNARHLTRYGRYDIKGSFTRADIAPTGSEDRWHVESRGEFDIWQNENNADSLSFEFNRASDVDYLQKYAYSYSDMLRSHVTAHKKFDNSYHTARALGFQTLNSIRSRENTPYILPQVKGVYEYSDNVELNYLTNFIEREQGVDQYKISAEVAYKPKVLVVDGHELNYKINLRSDFYYQDDYIVAGVEQDDLEARLLPMANMAWKYPIIKRSGNYSILLEPTIMASFVPDDLNKDEISNEDSQVAELSDANLFNYNHFSGTDIIEEGTTINYGVKGLLKNNFGKFNFLLGQSFHTNKNSSFSITSGFNEKFSDYIGRISFSNWLFDDLSWSFRLDHEDFKMRKNEISAIINHNRITLDFDYVSVNEKGVANDKEDVKFTGSFNINENWSISGYSQRDLQNSDWIENGAEVLYSGECVDIGVRFKRNYFTGVGIEPDTSISLRLALKTLGGS